MTTISMLSYSKNDVVLVRYPFSDFSRGKVRPAVCLSNVGDKYDDLFIAPLTSRIDKLSDNEFPLLEWKDAGLNVPSGIKRGIFLIDRSLIVQRTGKLTREDSDRLHLTVRKWLELD